MRESSTRVTCFGIVAVVLCAALAGRADAAVITADTTGADNFTTADFYGVSFDSGAGFIQSVTYDLTVDSDAFFDFDGSTSFADAVAPVLGTLVGLSAGDISFSFTGVHPTSLTINFAAGSFSAGDSLRFAADTDFLFSDPAPGTVFGAAGVPFSVVLEGGAAGSDVFEVARAGSIAVVQIGETATPEPASLALMGLGGVGILGGWYRRRRGAA
jgi:PEP-CTERM motif